MRTKKQILIVYIALTIVTLTVYWQVNQFDFVNFDDNILVTENNHLQSGITLDGVRWAFSTNHFPIWIPMIWLSLMLDFQIFGMNAGGYHVTNLILHILSTLLLFWLLCRMTGAVWKSAFAAAFFALHPLHVESVAWVTERKDVLSAFFWMLTLCFYVYYTEKPLIRRYLLVLSSFVLAMMSKPMVITLPLIMILLDYWPLKRFDSKRNNPFLWQLKEKLPLFLLSVCLTIFTIYNADKIGKYNKYFQIIPIDSRLANACVSFFSYLEKTFWPYGMTCFYPFPSYIPLWQVLGSFLLIILITAVVCTTVKHMPYLFVGWMWYAVTILPVIGIIQISLEAPYAMADRYHYLPSIGIAVMMAWGIPLLFQREGMRKRILIPAAIIFLFVLAVFTRLQCSYWKNSVTLFRHTLQFTDNNYFAHNGLALALFDEGKTAEAIEHFDAAVSLKPDNFIAYYGRGIGYAKLGQYEKAFEDYNKAINIKPQHYYLFKAYNTIGIAYAETDQYQMALYYFNKAVSVKPDYADSYYNRGVTYAKIGQYQKAIDDYNKCIILKPDYAEAYYNRGVAYTNQGHYQKAIDSYDKAIQLKPDNADAYYNRGINQYILGRQESAIKDFSQTIDLKKDDADAYNSRAIAYLNQGNKQLGCSDAQIACKMKVCEAFKIAKDKGLCH